LPSLLSCCRATCPFPDGTGYATSSTEGRIAIDFLDPNPAVQAGKYAFKCHRQKQPSGEDKVFPVHAIAFHPTFGTFASGGGDGE
jgi:cell cycle arrest protein BUB3